MKTYLLLLFAVLLLLSCLDGAANIKLDENSRNVFDTLDTAGHCDGSVTLYEGSKVIVVTEDEDNVRITVDKVRLEGCGCFRLHSRPRGRGRSYLLDRTGEHTVEDIGWSRVRSVRRVEC